MNLRLFAIGSMLLLVAFITRVAFTGTGEERASATRKTGEKILDAASELFAALSEKEISRALFEPGSEERINWHFIPRERKGLPIKDLDEGKRAKAIALLKASLSEEGARKAQGVMAHEAILGDVEKKSGTTPFVRDPLLYFVSFFGKPARDGKWGWRMEGHHLSLNFALSGGEVLSFTPAFYGANPAEVQEGPHKGFRLLAGVEDLGRGLVTSLNQEQLAACLTDADADVPKEVPGPGTARYEGPYPRGVTGKQLDEGQRKKLRDLIQEYIRNFPEDLVSVVSLTDLEGVHFAWRGGLKPLEGHSYLVHGPNFVLNYTDLQNGANHIHSCFRMLKGEFGRPQ
jgi:uncharacterized protein DUF3500